jgi:hypothetical protein
VRALVSLRHPDGSVWELGHGDLIGRLPWAALVLDDPAVSEAHAMVSLRGERLHLLALRRPVRVDGERRSEVALATGMALSFADDLTVTVVGVTLPDVVAALVGQDLPQQVLPPVASLFVRPRPRIVPTFEPAAAAWLWAMGDGWRLRRAGESGREGASLATGDAFEVEGASFRVVAVGLASAAGRATQAAGAVEPPLRIVAQFDTVHLQRDGLPTAVVSGLGARLISELVALGQPVGWDVLCGELWPGEDLEPHILRHRLDMTLLRLRRRLTEHGVRADLVQAGGTGLIALVLEEGDEVVDAT